MSDNAVKSDQKNKILALILILKKWFDKVLHCNRRRYYQECRSRIEQKKKIYAELDELGKNPKIEMIEVEKGCIVIYTKHLSMQSTNDHTGRDLGKLKITMNTITKKLRIDNLTRTIGSNESPHPHAFTSDHHPCLGNISQGVWRLIDQQQLGVVIPILIQYCETINEGSECSSLFRQWPRIAENIKNLQDDKKVA